jgi:hypothetical protein
MTTNNNNELANRVLSQEEQDQINQQMALDLTTRPMETLSRLGAIQEQNIIQRMAPNAIATAQLLVRSNPEWNAIYSNEAVKTNIDEWITGHAKTHGTVDPAQLADMMDKLSKMLNGFAGKSTNTFPVEVSKTGTVVNNADHDPNDPIAVWDYYNGLVKTNPAEFRRWEASPESRKIKEAALKLYKERGIKIN